MATEIVSVDSMPADIDVVAVGYWKGPVPVASFPDLETRWLELREFEGTPGQVQVVDAGGKTLIAIGLGDPAELTVDGYRRAGATFGRAVSKYERAALSILEGVPANLNRELVVQALAEGILLAGYRFNQYKSKPDESKLAHVSVVGAGDQAPLERADSVAEAVFLARDLVNQPASAMTPRRLAEVASEVAERAGLGITVLDEVAIERERLGGLRGVSMGSSEPPRLIELTYEPEGFEATVALVGKGITFDSGGLSLKPADGMMTMKTDMSGAAAVIATMSVLGALDTKVKVTGIVCATENLPGPKATKPGDVLRARNGKTMEVLNTDAEGRLVLADGLSLAAEAGVDAIIDVATLTGACVVALGGDIAGLMGNNDELVHQIEVAAENAGEPVWHLPLPKQYRKHIDSDIADIKNIGAPKGAAGTLTAGLFLEEFVDDRAWVHLDIAGPSRAESDDAYVSKGGTGFGVRTLIELLRDFVTPS